MSSAEPSPPPPNQELLLQPMIPTGSQVLVTLDADAAYFVDLSASTSPAAIKERIYAKLGIYDDDHLNCRISRCRAGQPIGNPLDDWQLWDMCMRATQDSDPPMLIVLSPNNNNQNNQNNQNNLNSNLNNQNHHLNHPPLSNHQVSYPPPPRRNSNHIHSPNSSDSHSHLKHDHSSSIGSRDSALDLSSHHPPPSRSRFQRLSRDHIHPPISPQPRDSSSSSSQRPTLLPTSSSNDLHRHQSSNPVFVSSHPSPIAPPFSDDRRISPNSNLPFDLQVHPAPRRPSRPQIEPPDDWVRLQHPSKLSPESSSSPTSRHHRIPSDPPIRNGSSSALPQLPSQSDPRFHPEYSRAYRSAASPNPKNPPAHGITRRFPPPSSSNRRGDLQMAKSMEELHVKRIPTNLNHPPLPNDSAIKIAGSPASRPPPQSRVARTDPSVQRPSQPSRPSYPPQPPSSFPAFPQPSINNSHMRSARTVGPPGYGPSGPGQASFRTDPRAATVTGAGSRPPPSSNPAHPSPNPRVSLQIPDNRYFDLVRPPPRPRTGDGSSSFRSDRQMQAPLATQSHIQQAFSHSSISIRPGDILQDTVSNVRRREQSREYRTELEREPAQRRPKNASPTTSQSLSSRSARNEEQLEIFRSAPSAPPTRRPNPEAGLQTSSRSLPFDKPLVKQDGSVHSLDHLPTSSVLSPGHVHQDAYGGFEAELINQPTASRDPEQSSSFVKRVERVGPSKNQLSLTIPQGYNRTASNGKRRIGNGARYSDEGVVHDHQDTNSPADSKSLHSAGFEDGVNSESIKKFGRVRSATTTSALTGTFTSFEDSSAGVTSVTTPSTKSKMFGDCEIDDDDEEVGTFVTPMQPYKVQQDLDPSPPQQPSLMKPKLSLDTETSNLTPLLIPELELPDLNLAGENTPGPKTISGSTTLINTPGGGSNGHLNVEPEDQRESRRVSFTGDDWAVRPPVDAVYENLEDFFPHHDLDKPIDVGVVPTDLNSPSSPAAGGSSLSTGPGPATPPIAPNGPPGHAISATSLARLKGRTRSIRVVAQEKKKLLRRTEDRARAASQQSFGPLPQAATNALTARSDATSASLTDHRRGSNLLRRKSTKLWGVKIVELVPGAQVSIPSSIDETSTGDNPENFSFKWVKGELIGKGSFGQVYLALNATNGEMLAVKQVELPKTRSDRECERQKSVVNALKSEIHLMRDLEHPNIVQYLGFEETTVYLSIFLEYVPGGSIARCLRRHGAFELNVIKYFTFQTLEGLKYLHSLHILHRDLKADNLLVDFSGNCKISDFGISKKSEHVYENNTQMSLQGSIFWMAPEVVHNPSKKGYSAKVDIWSLGCVVLEMFAGRRPWSDEEAIQAMFKLGAERLRPPVPPDVKLGRMSDHFLAQCFIVDPDQRPTADRLTDHRFLEIDDALWRFEDSELYRSIRMPH